MSNTLIKYAHITFLFFSFFWCVCGKGGSNLILNSVERRGETWIKLETQKIGDSNNIHFKQRGVPLYNESAPPFVGFLTTAGHVSGVEHDSSRLDKTGSMIANFIQIIMEDPNRTYFILLRWYISFGYDSKSSNFMLRISTILKQN